MPTASLSKVHRIACCSRNLSSDSLTISSWCFMLRSVMLDLESKFPSWSLFSRVFARLRLSDIVLTLVLRCFAMAIAAFSSSLI